MATTLVFILNDLDCGGGETYGSSSPQTAKWPVKTCRGAGNGFDSTPLSTWCLLSLNQNELAPTKLPPLTENVSLRAADEEKPSLNKHNTHP